MACILKAPSEQSSGVIVLTTQERDHQINKDPALRAAITQLKDRWLIGLHHNWHDTKFKYDTLFDFSMAGEGDLVEVNGKGVPLVPMDACNFVPDMFEFSTGEKFWDILYVARAVYFKRIPEFFNCIRRLYDNGHKYRVLFICPVPPYEKSEEKTVFYKIRDIYDKMFTEQEKDLFTLLTINYRYPFPFDLETVAHFYRSSKVFVHTADDEKRCRVAAYAWASGLPVVGMDCVGGLLAPQARCAPYFFEPKRYADFPAQIVKAISSLPALEWDQSLMRETFSESVTTDVLNHWLNKMAIRRDIKYNLDGLSRMNLSLRLGRHHSGVAGPNSLKTKLADFVNWMSINEAKLADFLVAVDPERLMETSVKPSGITGLWKSFIQIT